MPSYRGTADRPGVDRASRAKAIAAVVAVHAALAFVIFAGLKVPTVKNAVERLTTLEIKLTPPPPAQPPRPAPKPSLAKKPEGAPARRAEPTPVVAPAAKLPTPSPIAAANIPGTGSATASGAATSGSGTGAGGSGNGPGGGGYADMSRFTPARLVSNIPNFEYAHLASTGLRSGQVGVTILVNRDGSVSNCRVARSGGDPGIDSLVCRLTLQYVRFEPARDPYGRAVAQDITYFPTWRRR